MCIKPLSALRATFPKGDSKRKRAIRATFPKGDSKGSRLHLWGFCVILSRNGFTKFIQAVSEGSRSTKFESIDQ